MARNPVIHEYFFKRNIVLYVCKKNRTPIYLECGFCCLRLIFTLALVFYSFSGKPKVAGGRGVVFS